MIKLEVDDQINNSNVACGAGNKDTSTPCPMSGPIVKRSLLSLLGPTAFPLTHTTGIVERSVRLIKSYSEPPAHDKLPKSPVASHAEPEAVEIELEGRFAKVVLEPWIGWDDYSNIMPSMAKPRILETSVGPVHGVVGVNGEVEPLRTEPTTRRVQGEGLVPHDPFMDDITVLVDPALLPSLSVGMGIGGTWVQLARQVDFDGEKEKTHQFTTGSRYWYIDELALVLPSYLV
ncbi:hypothetical protein H0H93_001267 [Arthromyces matolae]|nr:hypothetical protein H0H93_001267 [Arthromyces matolae]